MSDHYENDRAVAEVERHWGHLVVFMMMMMFLVYGGLFAFRMAVSMPYEIREGHVGLASRPKTLKMPFTSSKNFTCFPVGRYAAREFTGGFFTAAAEVWEIPIGEQAVKFAIRTDGRAGVSGFLANTFTDPDPILVTGTLYFVGDENTVLAMADTLEAQSDERATFVPNFYPLLLDPLQQALTAAHGAREDKGEFTKKANGALRGSLEDLKITRARIEVDSIAKAEPEDESGSFYEAESLVYGATQTIQRSERTPEVALEALVDSLWGIIPISILIFGFFLLAPGGFEFLIWICSAGRAGSRF